MKQITILACLIVLLLVLQFSTEHVVGTDPYYHVQVSKLGSGLFSKHFEWTQASLFKDHYADKEFIITTIWSVLIRFSCMRMIHNYGSNGEPLWWVNPNIPRLRSRPSSTPAMPFIN